MEENVLNALVTPIAILKQQLNARKAIHASHVQIRVNALISLLHRLVIVLQESVSNVLII